MTLGAHLPTPEPGPDRSMPPALATGAIILVLVILIGWWLL